MGLTGIQILQMLPKKNCKECGFPTCLAFAMKVAAGQADIATCPYVSDEVKEKISEASAPPIRTVKLGSGDHVVAIGGETVLFRHEKRFENPPPVGILLTTAMSPEEAEARLAKFKKFRWERVGVKLEPEVIAIEDASGEAKKFVALVK